MPDTVTTEDALLELADEIAIQRTNGKLPTSHNAMELADVLGDTLLLAAKEKRADSILRERLKELAHDANDLCDEIVEAVNDWTNRNEPSEPIRAEIIAAAREGVTT